MRSDVKYVRETHACLTECLTKIMINRQHLTWEDFKSGGPVFVRKPTGTLQDIRLDVARGRLRAGDYDAPCVCEARLQNAMQTLSNLFTKRPICTDMESPVPACLVDFLIAKLTRLIEDWPWVDTSTNSVFAMMSRA